MPSCPSTDTMPSCRELILMVVSGLNRFLRLQESKIKIYFGTQLELMISAASLVQWWVQRYCFSSVASLEDQVCWKSGYGRILGAIGLAVLSGLGRR